MAKYPISHSGSKKLGEFFEEILTFHIPPSKEKAILDPTCGKKHLWEEYLKRNCYGKTKLEEYGKVIFSDIKPYGQEIVSDVNSLNFNQEFDGIIYDPPYFFGYEGSRDPRKEDYGDYVQTYEELLKFMDTANSKFPTWLKKNGKLILKCADQYQTKERKFYHHHYTWINRLTSFEITDFFHFHTP